MRRGTSRALAPRAAATARRRPTSGTSSEGGSTGPVGARLRLADGRFVGYREYGLLDGPPLLFLHGFPGSRHAGELLDAAARRAGVCVVAPERPGIGLSSPRPGRALLDYASDLEQIADRLGIGRLVLVADSGGGPYALACAYALPERLTAVSVVGGLGPAAGAAATAGMAFGERVGFAIARRAPVLSGHALAAIARWGRRRPSAFLRLCKSQLAAPDRDVLERPGVAAIFVCDFQEAFRQGGRAVGEELALLMGAWPFGTAEIRVPVRFCHGALDRTVPVGVSRELAASIPRAELEVWPDEGHLSILVRRGDEIVRSARR